jgi:hypothetical protein
MRYYNKNGLRYHDGYLLDDTNQILVPSCDLIRQFNELEHKLQEARWKAKLPSVKASSDFKFDSEHNVTTFRYEAETPCLDEQVEWSLKIMEELDEVEKADKRNKIINELSLVVEFVENDKVLVDDSGKLSMDRFDLKNIGNPLELTSDKLHEIIEEIG